MAIKKLRELELILADTWQFIRSLSRQRNELKEEIKQSERDPEATTHSLKELRK